MYGGLELYKSQVTEREYGRAAETADVVAAQIDASTREREDFVGFAASRPEASSFETADEFARGMVNDSRFYAVQVVDANGTVLAFESDITDRVRERTVGTNVTDDAYVREALTGRTYVSDPEYTATREYIVVISSPISKDGEVVGVLAAALYVEVGPILTPVQPIPSEHRAVAVVANGEPLYEAGPTLENGIVADAHVESAGRPFA